MTLENLERARELHSEVADKREFDSWSKNLRIG